MKKNFKKLSSLALAFLLVFSLSFSAFAADISADKAKSIALKDAGYSSSEVSRLSAKSEYDDGVKYYDVSFVVNRNDGSYLEYDYDVRVSDGRILEKDVDVEKGKAPAASPSSSSSSSKNLSKAQAKSAALRHFGLKAEDVKFLKVSKEKDDGRSVYEIEFCKPWSVKYSCEVAVSGGKVYDAEKESVRGLGDKLELFVEALLWSVLDK